MRRVVLALLTAVVAIAVLRPEPERPEATILSISLPDRIRAGEEASAVVAAATGEDRPVTVFVIDALGTTRIEARLEQGSANITLPARARRLAGRVTVTAAAGGDAWASADMVVDPLPAVDPVVPLLGARSVVADGADRAMLAAIPEDRFGNPQADGTAVTVAIHREDGTGVDRSARVMGGVAWTWIPSGTRAGSTLVAVSSGTATGPAAYLQEVPGLPAAVELAVARRSAPADGRTLVAVETGELVDANGNRLLDGAAVVFTMTGPGETGRVAVASTVLGRASTYIEAPSVPGSMVLSASVGGVVSPPVTLVFTPQVTARNVPVSVRPGDTATAVTVGPVLGAAGAYLPDGTTVVITGPDATATCTLTAGTCSGRLPAGPVGPLVVAVAGAEITVEPGEGP